MPTAPKIALSLGIMILSFFLYIQPLKSKPLKKASVKPSSTSLQWNSEKNALRQARVDNKPGLLYFGADWCFPCKELEMTTFVDPKVSSYLAKHFAIAKIDGTEMTSKVGKVFNKYGVSILPRMIFVDSNGKILQESFKVNGYVSPEKLLQRLHEVKKFTQTK